MVTQVKRALLNAVKGQSSLLSLERVLPIDKEPVSGIAPQRHGIGNLAAIRDSQDSAI